MLNHTEPQAAELRARANRIRQYVRLFADGEIASTLLELANDLDRRASRLEKAAERKSGSQGGIGSDARRGHRTVADP